MAAWRNEIYFLVLKTLEEKFRISARPCNILYIDRIFDLRPRGTPILE